MTPSYRDVAPGEPLTEKETGMLTDFDAGMTRAELAEKYGFASANGAGNALNRARSKSGRESEIRAGGGGRTSIPRVTSVADQLRETIERLDNTSAELRERIETAEADAKLTPSAIVRDEREKLVRALDRATEAIERFDTMTDDEKAAMVQTRREAAKSRVESMRESMTERVAEAEAERVRVAAALAAVEALDA